MKESYKHLIENFKDISKLKWIKGINNFTNSAGLTFESLLNKNADSMFFPDYQGIEIKCTQRYSRYPITLFSKSFDGPLLYQMNEILKKDIIVVDIVGRISRSGSEIGTQRNKNLVFKINKDNISELFKIIKIYNVDLNENFQII